MSNDLIAVLANIALTLSLIVGVIFGIAQVKAAKRDRRERLTLETLRAFNSREFAQILQFLSTTKIPKNADEFSIWPKESKEIFIQFSQEMESLGIVLADKLIDIGLVDKILGSFVTTSWEKIRPLVLELRVKNNDPYLSEYFQWMAETIDERMKNNPRRPVFETSGQIDKNASH